MLEWITVILLILIGLGLIITELIFIPGTTIVGLIGAALTAVGIFFSYDYFGTATGTLVLLGSIIVAIGSLVYAFKSGSWKRFSLKETNKSKFNEDLTIDLKEGMEGVAISTLKPIGKGEFNEKQYEVKSFGNYINPGEKIKIIKIDNSQILVEPINN